ncbi:hypothetical protein [Nocardioides donggukensis]|uniref:Lipoprotein n=1 Tax=Nocardioides donggukensis TaxID=2774019 RepID=A0A927K3J3_9ACTN|nr:hypothetical protein [Nocardioides donggukensis]MBD8868088.1 hypothetical protein [Nocardioides donggukensis]
MLTRIAAPLLVAALVAGCGSDEGEETAADPATAAESESPTAAEPEGSAPGDPESAAFCEAFVSVGDVDEFEGMQRPFDELVSIGVPDGAPAGAADGLRIFVDVLAKSEDEKDLNRLGKKVPAKKQAKVASFFQYGSETCLTPPAP